MNRTRLSLYYLCSYLLTRDPLFLVLLGIVGLGFVLTASAYLAERS